MINNSNNEMCFSHLLQAKHVLSVYTKTFPQGVLVFDIFKYITIHIVSILNRRKLFALTEINVFLSKESVLVVYF